MKHFLSRLFSSFATLIIVTLIMAWITNVTLLSSTYLVAKADQSGLFGALSMQLPTLVFPGTGSDALRLQSELGRELSPAAVRSELGTFMGGIEGYIRQGSSLPKPPFAATINSLGATSDPTSSSDQQVSSPALVSIRHWYAIIAGWFLGLAGVGLVCAALAIIVNPSRALGTSLRMAISILISLALSYIGFKGLPALVADRMQLGPDLAPTLPVIKAWLSAVVAGMNDLIVQAAVVVALLFVVLIIIMLVMRRQKRRGEIQGPESPKHNAANDF